MKNLWEKALELLQKETTSVSFETWIHPLTPVHLDGSTAVLMAPNDFSRNQVINYKDLIQNSLNSLSALQLEVKFILPTDLEQYKREHGIDYTLEGHVNRDASLAVSHALKPKEAAPAAKSADYSSSMLNPSYTFDNFVVGSANMFAHSACVSVAENHGSFNPLFLYGGSGLGKTHLLHAIGNHVKAHSPEKKVIYVYCENFVNEFIATIKKNTYEQFRAKYCSCDMLLVDDIQFLEGKEQMQVNFFSTFNELYEHGKNVVLTCDKPPQSLKTLEDRMRTRFASGLIIDIGVPDYETRMAILQQQVEQKNVKIPTEVLAYLATNFVNSIRELEGALNTVIAYCFLVGPVTLDNAKEAVSKLISEEKRKKLSPETMLDIIAHYYNVTTEEICSKTRIKNLVVARQIAMYILAKYGDLTYERIGSIIGGKHHSTVLYGYNKISEELKANNPVVTQDVQALLHRIMG